MRNLQPYGRLARLVGLSLALVALAACGAAPQAPGGQAAPTAGAAAPAYPAQDSGAQAPTAYPAPLGEAPAANPAPALPAGLDFGALPADQAALAVGDLVQRTGAAIADVRVVSAEAVEWSDGSIGCPKPDMMYPQVITPGYKLVLAVGGQEYSYHASDRGEFFFCESPA